MSDWELANNKNSEIISTPSVQQSDWELYQPSKINNSANYQNIPFAKQISEFLVNHPKLSEKLNQYEKPIQKFNEVIQSTRLPSIGGGILQGAADIEASLANLPLELMGMEKISHPNLSQYLPQDPYSQGAFLGGEALGGYPLIGGAYSALNKLTPALTGVPRLLGELLKGSAIGYGVGEELPYGRNTGAALGGFASGLNQLLPSTIGKNIISFKKNIENQYKKGYNNLFSTAEKEGLGNITKPEGKLDYFFDNAANKFQKSIKKYFEEPLIRNAHDAQSDLGKFIRKFEDSNLTTPMRKAVNQAKSFQEALKNKIHASLESKPELKLKDKYQDLTKGYLTDVIPYKEMPGIAKYNKGKLIHSDLISKLLNTEKGKEFLIQEGSKYPELSLHKLLKNPFIEKILPGLGFGAGLVGAGYGGYELNKLYNRANE